MKINLLNKIRNNHCIGLVRLFIIYSALTAIVVSCILLIDILRIKFSKFEKKLTAIESEIVSTKDFIDNFNKNEKHSLELINTFNGLVNKYHPIDSIHIEDVAEVMADFFSKNGVEIYEVKFNQLDSKNCAQIVGTSSCKSYKIDFLFESFSEGLIFSVLKMFSQLMPGIIATKSITLEVDDIFENEEPLFFGNASIEWLFMM